MQVNQAEVEEQRGTVENFASLEKEKGRVEEVGEEKEKQEWDQSKVATESGNF